MPQEVQGLNDIVRNPIYSTGVGLLHYGLKQHKLGGARSGARTRAPRVKNEVSFFSRAKQWIQNNF
jgi:cell division protein FtsA